MSKASTAIKLGLVGSAALLLSYMTCRQDPGTSTQPGRTWFGGHGFGWHSSGSSMGVSSAGHSGSARGGFGASGHAVGA